jgi:hypothetical protein
MGNLTDAERPQAPRPAFVSMPAAVAAAIAHGNTISEINVCRWAATYRCEPTAIQEAWEAELSRQSQQPSNSYEVDGK